MSKPRKDILQDSLEAALHNSFLDAEAHEGLVSATTRYFGLSDHSGVQKLLEDVSAVLWGVMRAQVDDWTSERGLGEILKVVDEQCLRTIPQALANGTPTALAEPSLSMPSSSYGDVRYSCKRQQLEVLRKDLASRTLDMEEIKEQLAAEAERAAILSQKVATFGEKGLPAI